MARTSKSQVKANQNSIDFNKAENMALGSFMKRLVANGVEEVSLTSMHDVRRLFKCLNVMKSNAVKNLNGELSFEELAAENDKSFGYWAGTADNDFDSFA